MDPPDGPLPGLELCSRRPQPKRPENPNRHHASPDEAPQDQMASLSHTNVNGPNFK